MEMKLTKDNFLKSQYTWRSH